MNSLADCKYNIFLFLRIKCKRLVGNLKIKINLWMLIGMKIISMNIQTRGLSLHDTILIK